MSNNLELAKASLGDRIERLLNETSLDPNEANREAERMADLFADVEPQPFSIPMERFYGLPSYQFKDAVDIN